MNKFLLFILFVFFNTNYAQIHIGINGNSTTSNFPISDNHGNSYTQQIVLTDEYLYQNGIPGNITQVKWKIVSNASSITNFNSVKVYFGHTNKSRFESQSDFIPSNELTEVYNGTITATANNEWITIDLDTPFNYNALDNLVVAVLQNTPGISYPYFSSYSVDENRGIINYSSSAIDIDDLNTSNNFTNYIAQIQFAGEINDCLKVSNLVVSSNHPTFNVSWSANGLPLHYEYELRTYGTMGSGLNGLVSSGILDANSTSFSYDNTNNRYLMFYIKSVCSNISTSYVLKAESPNYTTILNNNKLKVGEGNVPYINLQGALKDTYYKNSLTNIWRALNFSNSFFMNSFGVDGNGHNEWNLNGSVVQNPVLRNIVFDYRNYVSQNNLGYGTVSVKGEIIINSKPLEVTYTYTLGENNNYIRIACKIKNIGTTAVTNLRTWYGVKDDWIGSTDSPLKTRGNITNGSFVPNNSMLERSKFLKIESNQEGAFFYTTYSKTNGIVSNTIYGWDNVMNTNPSNSPTSIQNDGAYALYFRFDDLQPNMSQEVDMYYAAGLLNELNAIIDDVVNSGGYINTISSNSAKFNTSPSQDVTGYYVVVPSGSTIPTKNEVISGQDYQGVTVLNSGDSFVEASELKQFSLINLSPNTSYDLHYVNQIIINNQTITSNVATFNFTTLEELNLNKNVTNINCNGDSTGSVTLQITGGLAPYTYLWSNNMTTETINNIPAGVYSVTVTDSNGETITGSATITQPTALASSITKSDVSCFGLSNGRANIVVSGGTSPYTYSWSHSNTLDTTIATNLTAGNYSVTITDSKQCSITIPYTITEPSEVLAPNITNTQTFCNSAIVSDIEKPNGISIKVYTTPTGGKELLEHTKLSSGVYYVSQAFNGCESLQRTLVDIIINDIGAPSSNGNGNVYSYGDFTGYNADVIYDGIDYSSVNNTFDLSTGYLITPTTLYNNVSPTRYLPENRLIESSTVSGLTYQLQPYNQNNSLRLNNNTTRLLNALSPITNVKTLYVLGASGQGGSNLNIKVNFEDGSYQDFNNLNFQDWFYGTNPEIIGLGRIWGNNIENNTSEPRLYKLSLEINSINYEKSISNIQFTKNSGGITNVMAVSYKSFETIQVCVNSTLADLEISGTSIKWYANETTTTVLPLSTILNDNSFYYATQIVNGCESLRMPFYIKFNHVQAPESQDQSFCISENKTIGDLVVTGTSIKWYSSNVSTTALNTTDVLVSGTYYATQTLNGCESVNRTPINVTIYNTSAPVSQDQSFCISENKTIGDLLATGTSIKWYSSNVSTTALNTTDVLVSGTYYATQTLNGCESVGRTPINVTIYNTPAPVSQDQLFCISENKTVGDLVVTGTAIKWYSSNVSTTALNTTDVLVSGTYYATQTLNGCENVNRTEVNVTIYNTPAPVSQDQSFCISENKTVGDLVATGTSIKWYSSNVSITALNTTDVLVSGTYYATQTLNECESVGRTPINVTIYNTPAPVSQDQSFCISENKTVGDLVATGTSIKWYSSNVSNTVLNTTDVLVSGTYYATQTLNGCESVNRTEVNITIYNTPAPVSQDQSFCISENKTVGDLVATGTSIKWYSSNVSITALNMTDVLVSGTYYATQTLNGCESVNRTEVNVTIYNTPAPVSQDQSFCISENKTVGDLVATGTAVKWYSSNVSTTVLNASDVLVSGTYYATQTLNGCESVNRTEVNVTIYNTPAPVSFNQTYCSTDNKTIGDLIAQGEDVKVYASLNSTVVLNDSVLLINGIYYLTQTLNGCESVNRTEVNVEVIDVQQITTSRLAVCRGTYLQDISVQGFNYRNLRWFNSINSTTVLQGSTVLNATGTYYLEIQQGICTSERVAFTLEVLPPVPVPNTESVQYICGSGLVSDLVVLTAENAIVHWYSSLVSASPLASNTRLTSGTYYVSQTIGHCTSVRKAVSVFVLSKVAPTYDSLTVCEGFKVSEVNWILPTGAVYEWYLSPTSPALPANTVFTTGTYYVARNHYGCISDLKRVQVTVNALPSAPTGDLVQSIALPGTLNDIVMNQAGVVWYLTQENAANNIGALSPNTPLIDGKVYYGVIENVFGCRSHSTAVRVNLYLSKDKLHLDKLKVYPNPTSSFVNIHYNQEIEKIEVYTLLGNLLQSISPESDQVQIDLSTYQAGTYMVKITVNKTSEIIKIIKK